MGISQYKLAKDINVTPMRISEIIRGKRSITAETALRLSRYFKVSPHYWLELQVRYDIEMLESQIGNQIDIEVKSPNNISGM